MKVAEDRCGELGQEMRVPAVARAQKLSFGSVEEVCANQIFGGAAVKRERGADNFCFFALAKVNCGKMRLFVVN